MIAVVTDSTCSLSPEIIKLHNIFIVPLTISFGQESYLDLPGANRREFYRRLATTAVLPTTSQPSAGEFITSYQQILTGNPAAEILVLTVSSKLSGTYQAARFGAQQFPEARIIVFDSLSVALGLGLMAVLAAEMAAADQFMTEILARLAQIRRNLTIVLMVDSLDYLKRGGRIGAASAYLGMLLQAKPILAVVDGQIKPLGRVRTIRKAIDRLVAELSAGLPGPHHPVQAGVMHAANSAAMQRLIDKMQGQFNISRLFTAEFGPVIGAHLGPGALGAGICPDFF
jgi:DegV family protein with EDD domain